MPPLPPLPIACIGALMFVLYLQKMVEIYALQRYFSIAIADLFR